MTDQPALATTIADAPAEVSALQPVLRFLRVVRYRKGPVILSLAVSCLLGGLYYATTPRVYQSNASLLVVKSGTNWTADMEAEQNGRSLINTYRNLLSSDEVIEGALDMLPPEHRGKLEGVPREKWSKAIRANLHVSAIRDTNILKVSYQAGDPHSAAATVEHLLNAYLAYMEDLHKDTASTLLETLMREQEKLENDIRQQQVKVSEARRDAGAIATSDQGNISHPVIERVMQLNLDWLTAHGRRLECEAQLAAIDHAIQNGQDPIQTALAMSDDAARSLLLDRLGVGSTSTAEISRQLFADQAQLRAELQILGPAHSKVKELESRIEAAQHHLSAGITQTSYSNPEQTVAMVRQLALQQIEQAATYENALYASYSEAKRQADELDSKLTHLETLTLDLNRIQGSYDVVLDRIKDIDLGRENGGIMASVPDRPSVQLVPIWPRLPVVGALALVLGLAGGLAIVYVQDLLDDHFRSPEELRMQLGLPVLAMIGKLESIHTVGMDAVHVHIMPTAAETEPFRTLRTALAFAADGVHSLVLSSSEPGDGKTTVAANLATVHAQSGKRTLLIDADMRRPGLSPMLNLRGVPGLSTVLRSEAAVADSMTQCVQTSMRENLDVLAAGPRPSNPTELLASDRFSELLAWAEANYDQVLLDSPPALVSDTAIIGRLVDGILLVMQPTKNRRRVVTRAVESFITLGINVLGIVINRLPDEDSKDYYGYGYGYGYSYGYSYGHDSGTAEDYAESEDPAIQLRPVTRRTA